MAAKSSFWEKYQSLSLREKKAALVGRKKLKRKIKKLSEENMRDLEYWAAFRLGSEVD